MDSLCRLRIVALLLPFVGACEAPSAELGIQALRPSTGEVGTGFGWSLAVSGEVAAVGAPIAAQVFVYRGLVEEAVLRAPAGSPGFVFGEAIALEEDVLAVSASTVPNPVEPTIRVVYVYRATAGAWSLEAELRRSDDADFGTALGVAGGRVFVAAPGNRAVEAYVHGDAGWMRENEIRSVTAPGFGRTFCARDRWIAIADGTSRPRPVIEVFERDGVSWSRAEPAMPTEGSVDGRFGAALACTDAELAVVDPSDVFIDGVPERGAVHVFDPHTGARIRTVASPVPTDGEKFGEALALADDGLLVAAPRLGPEVGAVLFFEGDDVRALGPLDPVDDESFGRALAITPDHLWIAAPDAIAPDTGRAVGAIYAVPREWR
jgi:hypothetical protein